jgi:2,3-bisphosphoglycerate-dependent phosphoglycerate mutase
MAAHGDTYTKRLYSLAMKLDNLTKEQVLELNIPTGVPLLYVYSGKQIVEHQYL